MAISNLSSDDSTVNGVVFVNGLFDSSLTPGTINADITNTTINDVRGVGIGAIAAVSGGDSFIDITAQNNTITDITGIAGSYFGDSANLAVAGYAGGASDTAEITINSVNNILTGGNDSCLLAGDLGPSFGLGVSAGTIDDTITSTGGNLSDDHTCTSYFNHPTDQNNLINLSSTLSSLADNGGLVPTMALLKNSPAVDAGVVVAGLTTDARGEVRPRGLAYDSGAYESPFTTASAAASSAIQADGALAETGTSLFIILAVAGFLITVGLVSYRYRRSV